MRDAETGDRLFEKVLKTSLNWGTEDSMMYVVGATKAEMLTDVRAIIPNHFLLVPGVGAQGGSLEEVCKYGLNNSCGLLVNSSRQIIYASSEADYAEAARREAIAVQTEMEFILKQNELI
jgi:orotidine-5'-phosphate decarboxylase